MENNTELISLDANDIKRRIFTIRGKQVMLDSDLAELYQVETKNLNKASNRNVERFPEDFRFKLTKEEFENLRFQTGTSSESYGGRRYMRSRSAWLSYVRAYTKRFHVFASFFINSDPASFISVMPKHFFPASFNEAPMWYTVFLSKIRKRS